MKPDRRRAGEMETVARALLEYVRQSGENGEWVAASVAFNHAIERHNNLEWVRYIRSKPRGKIPMTQAIKRVMDSSFPDIERDKRGNYRSAPVFFRVRVK